MSTLDDLWYGAAWPLRRLGLEPGRALANAQPSPAVVQASRAEQLAYIQAVHPARIGESPLSR
jgi:hypothetical protein